MRCRVFTCWLNLDWFLFIYERFIVKNPLRFYQQKICSIYYLHFSFEKFVPFQILKDLSVENLETISSTLLSKFYSEIDLSRIIQSRSFAIVWNTHFVIFSFYIQDSFQEGMFWRQPAIHSPNYSNIMGTKCEHKHM